MEKTKVLDFPRRSVYQEQSGWKKICILTVLAIFISFLGWVSETILFYFTRDGEFVDRGLLTLPFCPLYGFGVLLVYAVLRTPQTGIWGKIIGHTQSKIGKFFAVLLCILLYAVAAALLASLLEYATGFVYHRYFGTRLWSYRRHPDNINGYVSIRFSLLWGLLCVSVMGAVWYPLMNVLARINTKAVAVTAILFFALITADFVFNSVYLWLHGTRFLPFDFFSPQL
ncbi:MAG: putative ABC transporter permease [Clostridia bacterium]|nr:putative ABC transporter permease [Clostridia bacterium]